jgi:hypothetical protein
MTLDDLDRRHHQAVRLIRRRTAIAAAKAFVIGHERLDALVEKIADLYDLPAEDRVRLRPTRGIAALETGGRIAGMLRPARAFFGAGEALSIARNAGRVARTVARRGRGASRAIPLATLAWGGYAIGTAGWLYWQASAYEQAVHTLLKERIAHA